MSKEEIANVATHLPGSIASIALAAPMIVYACYHSNWTFIVTTCLFLAGMINMFTASTIYHWFPVGTTKAHLRIWDHSSIFVMIAGCYSPVAAALGGWMGITMISVMWTLALIGIVTKFFALGKHPKLSLALYLAMGWMALLVIYWLWYDLTPFAFWSIVTEGVFYSIGSYFFAHDEEHAYYHAIWHIFILLGSFSHTLAVFAMLA